MPAVRCLEAEPVNCVVPNSLQTTTPMHDDVLMRFRAFTSCFPGVKMVHDDDDWTYVTVFLCTHVTGSL
jgi:hypothetical protein